MKKKEIISGIYKIVNLVTGKIYVGSSKNIYRRWKEHKERFRNQRHGNIHLQRSWNNHGSDSFKIEIIEKCSRRLLFEREQYYLDKLQPFKDKGYNIGMKSSGGDNLTHHPNKDAIIKKMSDALKTRYANMTEEERKQKLGKCGKDNPNYNNRWSKKQRQRASELQKENPMEWTEDMRKRRSRAAILWWQDSSNNKKMSEKRKGEGNAFYGKHHTEATKTKISQIHRERFANLTAKERAEINPQTRKVIIDGTLYYGVSEAARQLGVCAGTICHRIKSPNPKFVGYFYTNTN